MYLRIKVALLGSPGSRKTFAESALRRDPHTFALLQDAEAADVVIVLDDNPHLPPHVCRGRTLGFQEVWLKDSDRLIRDIRTVFCESVPEAPACADSGTPAPLSVKEAVRRGAVMVSNSSSPLLIQGETGVGKDVLARRIHEMSCRRGQPFIPVNCSAIAPTLVESELWGCEKGAFTDAVSRPGLFEQAGSGTLFLDEIGELSPEIQVKLLRVLEEKHLKRVGGSRNIKLDFRLISATNRDLRKEVEAGRFRQDLFYRLGVLVITIPPLRSRMEEMPGLVREFLQDFKGVGISEEAMKCLSLHPWPGNIRELRNVVERATILAGEGMIEPHHVCFDGLLEFPDSAALEN